MAHHLEHTEHVERAKTAAHFFASAAPTFEDWLADEISPLPAEMFSVAYSIEGRGSCFTEMCDLLPGGHGPSSSRPIGGLVLKSTAWNTPPPRIFNTNFAAPLCGPRKRSLVRICSSELYLKPDDLEVPDLHSFLRATVPNADLSLADAQLEWLEQRGRNVLPDGDPLRSRHRFQRTPMDTQKACGFNTCMLLRSVRWSWRSSGIQN